VSDKKRGVKTNFPRAAKSGAEEAKNGIAFACYGNVSLYGRRAYSEGFMRLTEGIFYMSGMRKVIAVIALTLGIFGMNAIDASAGMSTILRGECGDSVIVGTDGVAVYDYYYNGYTVLQYGDGWSRPTIVQYTYYGYASYPGSGNYGDPWDPNPGDTSEAAPPYYCSLVHY